MTSRADEIQKLIADIDNLINSRVQPDLTLLPDQGSETREVLEKLRTFLVQEKERETLNNHNQNQLRVAEEKSRLSEKFLTQVDGNQSSQRTEPNQADREQGNLLLNQLKGELSTLIQPLQAELAAMMQERKILAQEIRQLEQRKLHNYSLSQQYAQQEQMISEFLQLLMSRIVSNLIPNILENYSKESSSNSTNNDKNTPAFSRSQPLLQTSEQTQRLTHLTRELDQRLLSLDATVNFVFEALQRNINTYHQSLNQGLGRMHSTGVQGEQLMTNFVKNLTQQLQQQAAMNLLSVPELQKNQSVSPAPSLSTQVNNIAPAAVEDDHLSSSNVVDSLESPGDQVDELYASLWGNDNLTISRGDVEDLPPSNIAQNIPESQSNPLEADGRGTTLESPMEPVQKLLDSSLQEADAELELWQEPSFEEDTNPEQPTDLSGLWPTEEGFTSTVSIQPSSADTSPVSELLTNLDGEQDELEVSSGLETAEVEDDSQQSSLVLHEQEQEHLDHDISTAPTDNLSMVTPRQLSPGENQSVNPDQMSLSQDLTQEFDQDLADLSEMLEPDFNLSLIFAALEDSINQPPNNFATATEADSDVDVFQINPISSPQTEAEFDFSPTTETQEQVSTEHRASLIGSPKFVKNKDVALNIQESIWYLGIDLGTTGISAALLNLSTAVVYPICWSADKQRGVSSFQESFRLPAEVYLPTGSVPPAETQSPEVQNFLAQANQEQKHNFYSVQLKPYLQVAIPYQNEQETWEPILQFNKFSAGPLIWVVRSLSKLLLTLKSDGHSTTQGLTASAVGLNQETFHEIINKIAGVICTCPSSCSETYRFNVREAVLSSKLVPHPQQVFFLEEAIASLLGRLDGAHGETVLTDYQGLNPARPDDHPMVGYTLVINIGATTTEMALVNLPENLEQLVHGDFMLHSFAYASNAIEQDIICQLLLPPRYRKTRQNYEEDSTTTANNFWQWQPTFADKVSFTSSLGLAELDLPQVGKPDIKARIRLQQKLQSSLLGQAVLDAALALKLILQQQDSFALELADQRWVLQRSDLENHVLIPFVRRLNQELKKLLAVSGLPATAINQAILTGGMASLEIVNTWLQQELPDAKIIQDLYLGKNGTPNCSRVAYGLAMLPLHPQVLEQSRQVYSDYFLFTKLLQYCSHRILSFDEILQLFEGDGINTTICQERLLAFLEGELPPGLIPATPDSAWISESTGNNSLYQSIAAAPLFKKRGNITYRVNLPQLQVLQPYLDAIKASNQQTMEEHYTVNFSLKLI
ncbi:hypothetical protein [Anabaenopsis arnoldii]|uniref:Uncharacterized protein n=1 Tax=Anabaenopsis arnoldii TaxID=2152938 RepID=A0ABT5ANA0_9CYAN|nr:hypothetical protein [Anabaenopsis arnoldii]MDB9538785.1 hypothetical protein [Anabaenopsis arnoldii]MDH6091062.1 hypothetical protein [Anabaenopsis arnoldii]